MEFVNACPVAGGSVALYRDGKEYLLYGYSPTHDISCALVGKFTVDGKQATPQGLLKSTDSESRAALEEVCAVRAPAKSVLLGRFSTRKRAVAVRKGTVLKFKKD